MAAQRRKHAIVGIRHMQRAICELDGDDRERMLRMSSLLEKYPRFLLLGSSPPCDRVILSAILAMEGESEISIEEVTRRVQGRSHMDPIPSVQSISHSLRRLSDVRIAEIRHVRYQPPERPLRFAHSREGRGERDGRVRLLLSKQEVLFAFQNDTVFHTLHH